MDFKALVDLKIKVLIDFSASDIDIKTLSEKANKIAHQTFMPVKPDISITENYKKILEKEGMIIWKK